MRRFLHTLTMSCLLAPSTALPSRLDARRLGLVPTGGASVYSVRRSTGRISRDGYSEVW